MQLSPRQKVFLFCLASLAVLVFIFFEYHYVRSRQIAKVYSVVRFTNGDTYVGHLSTFPSLVLRDGYVIQTLKDQDNSGQTNFQLLPLAETVWSPQKIYIERSQVLFYGPLNNSSKIAATLRAAP